MIYVTLAGTDLRFEESSLHFSMARNGIDWNWEPDYTPVFTTAQEEIRFQSASSISHEVKENGLGKGILSRYEGFTVAGKPSAFTFSTWTWIEGATGNIFFEWIQIGRASCRERV